MTKRLAAPEVVPVENETLGRLANAVVVGVPFALLGWAMWSAWGGALRWQDIAVLVITYS
jgi:hypothetical protein